MPNEQHQISGYHIMDHQPLGPIVFLGLGTEFWMVISPQDVVMVKRYDACGGYF